MSSEIFNRITLWLIINVSVIMRCTPHTLTARDDTIAKQTSRRHIFTLQKYEFEVEKMRTAQAHTILYCYATCGWVGIQINRRMNRWTGFANPFSCQQHKFTHTLELALALSLCLFSLFFRSNLLSLCVLNFLLEDKFSIGVMSKPKIQLAPLQEQMTANINDVHTTMIEENPTIVKQWIKYKNFLFFCRWCWCL